MLNCLFALYFSIQTSAFSIAPRERRSSHRDPEKPAAHVSVCLALLPSGPDAVRRLILHRFRAAVRRAGSVCHAKSRGILSVYLQNRF